MEIIERLPLEKIHYLNSLTFADFKLYCNSSCKNDEERKVQFDILKNYCKTNIKCKGEVKRIYAFTETTPTEIGGRLFCGNSIQGMGKKIRGFLMKHTTDIDMKNAHPVILKYVCKLHNIKCPNLTYYINNRDDIIKEIPDGKTQFLKALNSENLNKKIKNKFFKEFDKEMKFIQQQLYNLPCNKNVVDSIPSNRTYNWLGSVINRIMCIYENKILQSVIKVITKNNIEIDALMFDGLMVYGDLSNSNLLTEIEECVNNDYTGLNMKFAFKEHDNDIILPTDFVIPSDEKNTAENNKLLNFESFKKVADEFEKQHAKIVNKSIFVKELPTEIIIMSKQQIKTSYENRTYKYFDNLHGIIDKCFIDDWLRCNSSQRTYEDVGIFPNGITCPSNIMNLWRPFAMELVVDYTEKPKE